MPKVKSIKAKIQETKNLSENPGGHGVREDSAEASYSDDAQTSRPNNAGSESFRMGSKSSELKEDTSSTPPPRRPGLDEIDSAGRIEIEFPGSEFVRAKLPKPFELAEAVATDWVKGGDFSSLPLDNPLAQEWARQGLLKAKELEKKVLESPHTEKIVTKIFELGLEVSQKVNAIKNLRKK